ncbi:hypothetical protein [Amycolatopsis dongchuanensis]|uniref:Uncharacterized protein n=2 Tax=Amycolatopsis TaxID=1813 RepID=A0ABP9QYI9_9PSEU
MVDKPSSTVTWENGTAVMQLIVTRPDVELAEPDDCKRFSVRVAGEVDAAELERILDAEGVGELADGGEHVFVSIEALRKLASGRTGPGWPEDFAAMLAYAGSKGWLNDAADRVRAHIERG